MTVNANYSGNIIRPATVTLAGTTKTPVGSVATDNTLTVASWAFVNPTAGAVNCELYWNDGTTDYLVWRRPVPANDTLVESNLPIRLASGHSIKALGVASIAVALIYSQVISTR